MRPVVRAHVTQEQDRRHEHTPHEPDDGRDRDRRNRHHHGERQQRWAHEQPYEHGHGDLGSTQATARNLGDIRAHLRGVMTMDLVGSSHAMRLTEHSSHRFRVSP